MRRPPPAKPIHLYVEAQRHCVLPNAQTVRQNALRFDALSCTRSRPTLRQELNIFYLSTQRTVMSPVRVQ